MKFLIDANLPRSIVELIAELGHEAEFARDIGMAAAPDSEIAARALQTGAVLLTRDLDFADIRNYPPARYSGIVILRVPDDAIATDIVRTAGLFLRVPAFVTQLSGRLAIVEPERVRFRPPLP
jgi:predicted nuclease of predicted toxin-antitoxin system